MLQEMVLTHPSFFDNNEKVLATLFKKSWLAQFLSSFREKQETPLVDILYPRIWVYMRKHKKIFIMYYEIMLYHYR